MQFEELDKRINEAASHHQPAFDTKAWEKMNQLLDKELPQKKEKKRRIFLFLLFLLPLAAGSFFILSNQSNKKPVTTLQYISKPSSFENSSTHEQELKKETGISKPGDKIEKGLDKTITGNNVNNKKTSLIHAKTQPAVLNTDSQTGVVKNTPTFTRKEKSDKGFMSITTNPASISSTPENDNSNNQTLSVQATSETSKNKPADLIVEKNTMNENSSINKDSSVSTSNTKKNIQSKHLSRWALTFSTGPDVSEANSNSMGKTTMTLGAGISYSLSKKFTLRTGFYTSKKIYSASAGSYHPPAGYWTYYYDLKKIDANCTVYEIPLTISYNFAQAKKHTWFGSAGLSSYLMKRETYDYTYKDYAGQLQNKSWTIENKNKHYFSVLDLSAGYKYSISKKVSLIAEPYMKLPLSGVGFGKIKLSSGGVLFTVSISAFGKH
ncbi:MAG: hypothetical protein JSU05_03240 [Bacteroidetes bacterium]|nr:hypothetical protein [Bacteroidota bacterium]